MSDRGSIRSNPWVLTDLSSSHTDFSENLKPSEGESSEGKLIFNFTLKGSNPLYRVSFAGEPYFAVNLPFTPVKWGSGATQISISGIALNVKEVTLEGFVNPVVGEVYKIMDERLNSTFYLHNDYLTTDIVINCYALSSTLNSREVNVLVTSAQSIKEEFDTFTQVTFKGYQNNVVGNPELITGSIIDQLIMGIEQISTINNKLNPLITSLDEVNVNLATLSTTVDENKNHLDAQEVIVIKNKVDIDNNKIKIAEIDGYYRPTKIEIKDHELVFTSDIRSITIDLDPTRVINIPWYSNTNQLFIESLSEPGLEGLTISPKVAGSILKGYTVTLTGTESVTTRVNIVQIII